MSAVEETAPLKPKRPKIQYKRQVGRPTTFSQEKADLICREIARGKTLKEACENPNMPDYLNVLKWIRNYPEFGAKYSEAKEAQADAWADDIIDIADSEKRAKSEGRARLMIETRKWLMARLAPRKYGDKTTAELTGTVVLTLADLVNSSYQEPKLVEGREIKPEDDK